MLTSHSPQTCSTAFLDVLAGELKIGRSSAYRHAVQKTLEMVRKNFKAGKYQSTTEAEFMLRRLADIEERRTV